MKSKKTDDKKTFFLRIASIMVLILVQSCSIYDSFQRKNLELTTQLTNEAIKKSEALQELDKVCASVALPEGFKFVSKGGIDDQKISLSYYYNSEIPFEEIYEVFRKHFSEKGWSEKNLAHRYPKQVEFYNDDYRIYLSHGSGNLSNYGVNCEKLK
jgi:hypothetical protein